MKNTLRTLLALSFLSAQAGAATINWSTADVNDINDVVTTGDLIEAQNHSGTGAAATVTVAGIDFVRTTDILDVGDNNGDFFAYDTGDAAYNELLGDIDFNGGDQKTVTITFNGLTDTAQYLVQVWYTDDGGFGLDPQRTITLTGTGDNVLNGNDFATGTFIADSTTQDLVVNSSRQGVRLNAVQLRQVPEPSIALLSGLGLLGLLRRRRN